MLKWCTVPWGIKQLVFSIRVHENCVHRDFQHQGHPLTQPLPGTMTDSLSEISDSCSSYLRHTGLAISLWQRCDDFFLSFLYHTHTHTNIAYRIDSVLMSLFILDTFTFVTMSPQKQKRCHGRTRIFLERWNYSLRQFPPPCLCFAFIVLSHASQRCNLASIFIVFTTAWRIALGLYLPCCRVKICSTNMMTSSNGNIFRVTGHLCGKFTGHRWISHTKASDAELWCLLWSAPERTVE